MGESISHELLQAVMAATPEQTDTIERFLAGAPIRAEVKGPLLMTMTEGAKLLGVSRATLWRLSKFGRLPKVELFPGSLRVRRQDLLDIVRERSDSAN